MVRTFFLGPSSSALAFFFFFFPLPPFLPFFFFFTITLNLFLEDEVDWDLVVFLEVAWHRDFNDRWVILEIEKQTV